MPTVGNGRIGTLGFQLTVVFGAATLSNGAATLGGRTAACGSRAASHYATREVVAGKENLEVVGDEGAHEAVGVADLVLRLLEDIKKHYKGAVLPGRPKKAQKIRSQTKKIQTYESINV